MENLGEGSKIAVRHAHAVQTIHVDPTGRPVEAGEGRRCLVVALARNWQKTALKPTALHF